MRKFLAILFGGAALAGCNAVSGPNYPAVSVFAKGETEPVGTANADAADDPAVWRNAADPAGSLIVGTDKKAGLYVYGMDGKVRHFLAAGQVNNVDIVQLGPELTIVAASDRSDRQEAKVALFRLNTVSAKLEPLGKIDSGSGEAYGLCAYVPQSEGQEQAFTVFAVLKDGTIHQLGVNRDWSGSIVRNMQVPSQAEGCVVDAADQTLYVGEENAGIWRFPLTGSGAGEGELIVPMGNEQLAADVEGLAIGHGADGKRYLVASSQGDNAYAVYQLPAAAYVGRFRIGAGQFGSTEETDGIAIGAGSFGPDYPAGLFVAQDGQNAPHAQNFKLVSWAEILAALAKD